MKKITINDFLNDISYYILQAQNWKIFVYPTDTVYGIWSIINPWLIEKLYDIKWREKTKNLSIIAPNYAWIKKSFVVPDWFEKKLEESLSKYHWITLLLRKIDEKDFLDISSNQKVWVRILKHPFQQFVEQLWEPFITTSANISWTGSIANLKFLDDRISNRVDYIIDWWTLYGKPSVIIDIEENSVEERLK